MGYKTLRLAVALLGGLALTLILAWVVLAGQAVPVQAAPGVLYVAPGGNCNGASPCYGSVQAAVDMANPGDIIKVAAGTYTGVSTRAGVTQVVYISKTVTIQGGYTTTNWMTFNPDANLTTLDAQGQGRVLYIIGDIAPVIEGLRITGGNAAGMGGGYWGFDCGGGVYLNHQNANNASTLNNNQVFNNTAGIGGGLCLHYGTPTLNGNAVSFNTAGGGGGLWIYQTTGATLLRGNTISSNTSSGGGGGLLVWGGAELDGNTIISNTSSNMGGGLFLEGSDATLSGNVIRGNTDSGTGYWWNGGGGLYMCCGSTSTLINNVIADNCATSGSGGLMVRESSPRLLHTTIARNSGGDGSGVYVFSSPSGASSIVALTNTILVSHSLGISIAGGHTATVNGVLWYNTPVTVSQAPTATVIVQSQHWGDPAFAADNYHITTGSAALDWGMEAGVKMDIDDEARPFGLGPDLGADEWASVETTAEPSTASIISATVGGLTTTVKVPANTVTEATTLKYTALAATAYADPPGSSLASHAFDLDAYRGGALLPGFVFSVPVTVTIHYNTGLKEDSLVLEYWNGSAWKDAACGPYDRHPTDNWLAVPVCHLSRFALFGERHAVYLPLVMRNY